METFRPLKKVEDTLKLWARQLNYQLTHLFAVTSYTPTLTWTTGTPATNVSYKFQYQVIGKLCFVTGYYTADDGNGATALTITTPYTQKSYSGEYLQSFSAHQLVDTTWSNPLAYLDDNDGLIKFNSFTTCTDNTSVKILVSGFYEIN